MNWEDWLSKGWGPLAAALIAASVASVIEQRSRRIRNWQALKAQLDVAELLEDEFVSAELKADAAKRASKAVRARPSKLFVVGQVALGIALAVSLAGVFTGTLSEAAMESFDRVAVPALGLMLLVTVFVMKKLDIYPEKREPKPKNGDGSEVQ